MDCGSLAKATVAGMDAPVALPTQWLQIFWPMCTSMGSELPVMNLQQMGAATTGAPPSVLFQNLPAVDLVHTIHE